MIKTLISSFNFVSDSSVLNTLDEAQKTFTKKLVQEVSIFNVGYTLNLPFVAFYIYHLQVLLVLDYKGLQILTVMPVLSVVVFPANEHVSL